MKKGLILVGAGPGDPDLLTIKGLKAIERADVILYDALASPQLLEFAKAGCKKIYVGKRAGAHSMAQSTINSLIVKYAAKQLVVRLKGGDPFVFGRGFEECEVARENNIEVQVIPGISSAIAAPAAAGIPVTTRGVSRSFWVVTATDVDHQLNSDLHLAAESSATLIILMGMQKLERIATLVASARGVSEPMAVIQNGTRPDQHVVYGSAGDLVKKMAKNPCAGPGIIVVGQVVAESKMNELLVNKLKETVLAA